MTIAELAAEVDAKGPVQVTPRKLVEMVGAKRRGSKIVDRVRSRLARHSLTTDQDLLDVGADEPIRVLKTEAETAAAPRYVEPLQAAVEQLEKTPNSPKTIPVREMLSWFGAQKRGSTIADRVEETLAGFELRTEPDFNSVHIDAEVQLVALASEPDTRQPAEQGDAAAEASAGDEMEPTASSTGSHDATFDVGTLDEANRDIISVKPQSTLRAAMSIMLAERLSHLPVMPNEHRVLCVLRWKDLGRHLILQGKISLDDPVEKVASEAATVRFDEPFLDVIPKIIQSSCVLVRGPQNKFTGIITKKDLGRQLLDRARPFVTLGEIERGLRVLIDRGEFTSTELKSWAVDPKSEKTVDGTSDLTLGEYQRLLEKPEAWERLDLAIEKSTFVQALGRVRQVRNSVMHFEPTGQSDVDHRGLWKFLQLIYDLRKSAEC